MQHRGPEQRVEIGDVLADEVDLLHRLIGHEGIEVAARLGEVVLQRGQIADRRVQPDVEIFAWRVGDLDAEIRCVAADVPVGQAGRFFNIRVLVLLEPFLDLVEHLGLQAARGLRPVFEEGDAARIAQLEEVMLRAFHHRRGAGQHRERLDQFGRRINGPALFTRVTVLIRFLADRANAFDEAVRQKHAFFGVVELLDGLDVDQFVASQRPVDVLRQRVVFRPVGRMPVVERDVEAVQIGRAARRDVRHELLGRDACLVGGNHDRRAMGIVRANEGHLGPHHSLKPHPGVGLRVLHDVADVKTGIGIGQGGGDEQLASHGGFVNRGRAHFRDCARPGQTAATGGVSSGPGASPGSLPSAGAPSSGEPSGLVALRWRFSSFCFFLANSRWRFSYE